MKLENRSYPQDLRNVFISLLYEKLDKLYEFDDEDKDEIGKLEKFVFILEKGIVAEYDKISIDTEDYILSSEEISEDVYNQVERIFSLFFELDGFINTDEQIRNHSKVSKLKFEGFNNHDDEELDNGQVHIAEYIIFKQKRFIQYKEKFQEGSGDIMNNYIEILDFFNNKEITTDLIIEYLDKL